MINTELLKPSNFLTLGIIIIIWIVIHEKFIKKFIGI